MQTVTLTPQPLCSNAPFRVQAEEDLTGRGSLQLPWKGRQQCGHTPPEPGRPWEFVPRWRDASGKDGKALSLFPSFIKLFPDPSGHGPSSQEISASHWGVCKPCLIQNHCSLPPLHSQLYPDSLCLLKWSEPLLFYFSPAEPFQEIDSYAKQCSKEHNAERIWEWVLRKKLAGDHVHIHRRAGEHYGDADILGVWWLPQYLTALTWVKT